MTTFDLLYWYFAFSFYLFVGYQLYKYIIKCVMSRPQRCEYHMLKAFSPKVRLVMALVFVLLWLPIFFVQGVLWIVKFVITYHYSE